MPPLTFLLNSELNIRYCKNFNVTSDVLQVNTLALSACAGSTVNQILSLACIYSNCVARCIVATDVSCTVYKSLQSYSLCQGNCYELLEI